jgi:hypothetical protein
LELKLFLEIWLIFKSLQYKSEKQSIAHQL